jgi:ribosomal protein S15P/S13E
MRINGKLYKKLASHLVDNPEDNSSYDELFQVVKKFRPDFINDQMLK